MQKIFYNANVYTMNEKEPCAEAFFVNDGMVVFVGSNEDVLQMKQDETELVDLNGKMVIPTFFDCNAQVYKLIEEELKNAKQEKYLENNDEIDENYEKFCNFDEYKKVFLKFQKEFIKKGITTIQEMGVTAKEFTFWKKLSEENLLEIDVAGYVDMLSSKAVMDNNCSTYRKYRKHFRLGGYYLALDGDLIEKKAYLKKPYKKEHGYKGYTLIHDEHLSFLFKTALEEKKQLVVETNGDASLEQFIRCFEEVVKEKNIEDKFKPIALKCGIVSKKHLQKLKQLDIIPNYQITDLSDHVKLLKKTLGAIKANKIQPIATSIDFELNCIICSNSSIIPNNFELLETMISRDGKNILGKKQKVSLKEALNISINHSSVACFDQVQKGGIENGKQASFLVCDDLFKLEKLRDTTIYDVYILGEKIKK